MDIDLNEDIEESLEYLVSTIEDLELVLSIEDSAHLGVSEFELDHLKKLLNHLQAEKMNQDEVQAKHPIIDALPSGFFDNPMALTSKDLIGLPEELLTQINNLDATETAIIELLEMARGPVILDKLIAGLYHTTKVLHNRSLLTSKLYRMVKKNLIVSVPKKKGVYSLPKEEE